MAVMPATFCNTNLFPESSNLLSIALQDIEYYITLYSEDWCYIFYASKSENTPKAKEKHTAVYHGLQFKSLWK